MNRISLRIRLLLLTLLPSAAIAIVLVTYFTLSGISTLEGELRAKGLSTVRYLAPISEYGIIAGQIESLHVLAHTAVQESGVKAAIVVNQRGRVIAVSGRVSLASETLRLNLNEAGQVAENERWVAFGAPVKRSFNDSDALFEPPTQTNTPALPEVIGHVFVEFDKTELARQQNYLFQRGLLIVFCGLLVLAILAVLMADTLVKPMMRLVGAVRDMSAGHFETRVKAVSSGELGILEHGFNEMAEHIEEVQRSMQSRIEEATSQLAFQARHDALTGLLNRREFEHRLTNALNCVQAGGDEFSVLFIDLDRFKPVNDACGHLAGDELLRQISLLFQGRLREEDTLARLGGDEFGIILANCSSARGRQVAEDICEMTSAYRFIWQDKIFMIGASIGLTPVTRRVRNLTEILAAVDTACFNAKDSGRNQVVEQEALNTPERPQETGNWAGRIAGALAENRLHLEVIPLRGLQSTASNEHFAEMTAHLHEPGQTSIALSALMDAAERYDLGPAIDLHFVEAALDALARAQSRHQSLRLLVPVSRASLDSREVIDCLLRGLTSKQLTGHGLCFIFSEDISTHSPNQAADFSRQIRALGCQIGLGDFGGGPSSISQLRTLAPSVVVLNQSLTRELNGNRASTALLRAIQEIASDLGIDTIAKDIDIPVALDQLATLGISYAQGDAVAPCEPLDVWLEGAVCR